LGPRIIIAYAWLSESVAVAVLGESLSRIGQDTCQNVLPLLFAMLFGTHVFRYQIITAWRSIWSRTHARPAHFHFFGT
jgi:hypothetical protein